MVKLYKIAQIYQINVNCQYEPISIQGAEAILAILAILAVLSILLLSNFVKTEFGGYFGKHQNESF